jgi:hypothetical protein
MTRLLDKTRWLAQLPTASEEEPVELVLVGDVLASTPETTRIISGYLCLTFASVDVIDVEPLDSLLAEVGDTRPSRLTVRRGAALLDACPRECVAAEMPPGEKPFAMSVRPFARDERPSTRFAALEAEYFADTGLVSNQT